MLKVGIGHSDDPDTQAAIDEVLDQCRQGIPQPEQVQAGVLFAALDFDHEAVLAAVHDAFPKIELIGGTTDGELSSVLGFQEDSLTLMVFSSDVLEIRSGLGERASENIEAAVAAAVQSALKKTSLPPRLCVTVPESLTVSGVSIVDNFIKILGEDIPVLGGTAGDQMQIQQTYQFCGRSVYSDAVPILIFSGDLLFSHGIASGWKPLGHAAVATHTEGNVVFRIGEETAAQYYANYINKETFSQEYPLAIWESPESDQFYLRAPFQFDLEKGSVTFLGDVPQGSLVQITSSNRDEVLEAASDAYHKALQDYPGNEPEAAMVFSCAARHIVLGTRTNEEYENFRKASPTVIPSCGFYTYGEIAPLAKGKNSQFHNETVVVLLLGTP
jgi:hypothetical protein